MTDGLAHKPAHRLAALFAGRTDAWGAIHGEAIRESLSDYDWWNHVHEDGSVGVYPLCPRVGRDVYQGVHGPSGDVDEWVVRWGCVDIDDGYDAGLVVARNLHKAYSVLGLTSWIERTKGKGYHVWLLCSDWVPAIQMRAVQILACQLIDYRPKEINPKQVSLADGQLGNYVNVPYARKWVDESKRVVLVAANAVWYRLEEFLDLAEATLNTPAKIAEVAALYREPPKPRVVVFDMRHVGPLDDALDLSPLTMKVWKEGPLPHPETGHIDRSAGLQRLAHLCAKDEVSPSTALKLVMDLDMRLGKYVGRRDAEEQYRKIVERAYEYVEPEGEP